MSVLTLWRRPRWAIAALAPALALAAAPLAAQAPGASEIATLQEEIAALREEYGQRLAALEQRLVELAAAPAAAAAAVPAPPAPPTTTGGVVQPSNYFNPAISLVGSFVAAGGHAAGGALAAAELEESEFALQAIIDPYARADVFMAFGEEGVEIEEGYTTFTSLPAGLLVKLGRMRAQFGKVNSQHVDVLPWVDQPLPVVNLLGEEGWIGTGVSVAKLLPLGETFSELTLQAFRGDAEGLFGARSRDELAYNGHFRLFRDLSEATNLDLGVSYGRGPTADAARGDTRLQGFNATLRWKPLRTANYRSATARAEVFQRRSAFGDGPAVEAVGWFAAADVRFARRWFAGARYESAERADDASLRDTGTALTLTFWPSEFSQFRLEPRRRRFAGGETADELLAQFQFSIGTHAAHAF